MYRLFLLFACAWAPANGEYTLHTERVLLTDYNRNFMKDVFFNYGKYNRTTSALNFRFEVIKTFPGKLMTTSVVGDLFYHNEYRPTGQKGTFNSCQVWRLNLFGIVNAMKAAGLKMDMCDIQMGKYHLLNFSVAAKQIPTLPLGRWRIGIRNDHPDMGRLYNIEWYLEAK